MGKSFQPLKKFSIFIDEFLKSSLSKESADNWLSDGSLSFDIRSQLTNLIEHCFEA
ncbi:MAG: hypothetical protein H7641_14285 [Candidatus Heimdallarchaeota archaeon]|nr:hypothetical protein [Candidatus Heimdallarchaeota archaeon]MCK4878730.1 hypothetical protein [Candidatus Heimdallarchaeota archaeon]